MPSNAMQNWWWNGTLTLKEVRERLQLKECLRSTTSRDALLQHAEQLVDYAIDQRALFRAALARIMELEAKEAIDTDRMAADLMQELGITQ